MNKQTSASSVDLRPNRRRSISPLSPIGLALISYAIFVAATLIPPGAYENIMHEPDRMFLNLPAHLYVALCVLSFCFGAMLMPKFRFGAGRDVKWRALSRNAVSLPPLLLIALNALSVSILLKNNHSLLTAWLTDANSVKKDFDGAGGMTAVLPMLYGASWWSFWRLLEREASSGKREWRLRLIVGGAFLFAIATSTMRVARADLMPGIFGMAIVYFAFRYRGSSVSFWKMATPLSKMAVTMIAFFVLLSWLRGHNDSTRILNNVAGYTVASYNRLAAMLDGKLVYPYGGTGIYGFRFLGENIPLVSRWINVNEIFGMPESDVAWNSEFPAVYRAGLDGTYIWASAFGYLYSDIGLFAFAYMFVIGAVSIVLWRRISRGSAFGIVLYPWFGFSILFWMGDNFVAYSRLLPLIVCGILLSSYDFFARRKLRAG
jgi:hypothetical protein